VPENSCTKLVHWQPRHAPCAIEGTASSTTPGCWTGHSARSIDVQERPPEPGSVVAWCLRLSHCGRASQDSAPCRHRRRVHHAAFEARPSRMPPTQLHGWRPTSPRPEPLTARYLADRRASGLGVEVHGGRAYRRLMVACETPLEHLSHAGSDDSRSSRPPPLSRQEWYRQRKLAKEDAND